MRPMVAKILPAGALQTCRLHGHRIGAYGAAPLSELGDAAVFDQGWFYISFLGVFRASILADFTFHAVILHPGTVL
jgi:hypothetical protein